MGLACGRPGTEIPYSVSIPMILRTVMARGYVSAPARSPLSH